MERRRVLAAGAVVWRRRKQGVGSDLSSIELLVVHRPKYDDWTFPKGKQDPGELLPCTAVREIEEETGVRARLGVPLTTLEYPQNSTSLKCVSYWSARVSGGGDVNDYEANDEVDDVRWVRATKAAARLTYERDRDVLARFAAVVEQNAHRTRTLVLLRHAKALSRSDWSGDDDLMRPLEKAAAQQLPAVDALLGAYGVERVISSEATRCISTVERYAARSGGYLLLDRRLNQAPKGKKQRPGPVIAAMDEVLDQKRPVVMCGHRPVLPWMFGAAGADDPRLAPGQLAVLHHRRGHLLATEVHPS